MTDSSRTTVINSHRRRLHDASARAKTLTQALTGLLGRPATFIPAKRKPRKR